MKIILIILIIMCLRYYKECRAIDSFPHSKKCSKILVCISEMYSGKRFFGISQFSKLATSSWDTKNTFSISFCKSGLLHHQISWSSGCDTYFWIRRPGFNSRPGIFLFFFKNSFFYSYLCFFQLFQTFFIEFDMY